jgi:hypothetical protein
MGEAVSISVDGRCLVKTAMMPVELNCMQGRRSSLLFAIG